MKAKFNRMDKLFSLMLNNIHPYIQYLNIFIYQPRLSVCSSFCIFAHPCIHLSFCSSVFLPVFPHVFLPSFTMLVVLSILMFVPMSVTMFVCP